MASILFRGVNYRHFQHVQPKDGAPFVRAHFRADLSSNIAEEMKWGAIPPCVTSNSKLSGELIAHNIVLTPNQKDLRGSQLEIECSEVSDFCACPVKNEDGEVKGHELAFAAKSVEPDAAAKLAAFVAIIGRGDCTMKVGYESQGQLELADGSAAADSDDKDDEPEADPQEGEPAEAPLAAATMMGGTHQKGTRGKRRGGAGPIPVDPGDADWGSTAEVV